ncbi:MAG: protein kinase [Gemmatimonadota bacterium]
MTAPDAPDLQSRLSEALAGQYRIERTLGQGGMGTVFLARDETLDRLVAIKVISPEVGTSSEVRQRFLQEARTVARLRHPNIVAVFAAGEAGGLLYFVMEYVPGESLRERLNRESKFSVDDAIPVLRDLALALDYAHAGGIVHRDVKPENVLLDGESGRAMLMDFGVARALANEGRLTGTGFVLGSPRYMSPEQASGDDNLDGRSDLYSLGLIAYEMFTGAPAVEAATAASVLVKHLTERPTPLRDVVREVPEDVAAAVNRLLEKSPDARFQRGAAFAAALVGESFDDKTPSNQIGRTSAGTRRAAHGRRRRTFMAGAAAGVIALVAAGAWLTNRNTAGNDKVWFVAPFEVQGPDRERLAWLREGSLNMLTLSLAQWTDLQVTEYERSLSLLRGEGVNGSERVDLEQAKKIANDIGAGRIVMGQIMSVGDSMIVTATLYDANGRSVEQARQAAPNGADPRPIFEGVASELLSLLGVQGIDVGVAKRTTTSVAAYRAYLEGLRYLNTWRLQQADSAFNVAIKLDSTFAMAYYKKSLAMGWIPSFDSTRRIASAKAVEYSDRLPQHLQELVRGHDELTQGFFANNVGDSTSTRAFLASRARLARLVATDSNDAEAWYALADADFHLVHRAKYGAAPDTAARYFTESLRGFERTIKLDPSFHLAYQHLVQIYAEAAAPTSNVVLAGDSLLPAGNATYERRIGTPEVVASLKSAARTRSRDAAAGWVRLDPDATEARRELANAYESMGQPDSAIQTLREAMRRPSTASPAFAWRIPLIKAKNGMPSAGPELRGVIARQGVDTVKNFRLQDRMQMVLGAMTVAAASGMPSILDSASAVLQKTDPMMPGSTQPSKFVAEWLTAGIKTSMGMPITGSMRSTLVNGVSTVERNPPGQRDVAIPYLAYLETGDTLFSSAARRWASSSTNGLPELQALEALERRDTTTAMRLAREFPSLDSLKRGVLGMNGVRLVARAEVMARLGNPRRAVEILEIIDPARFSPGSMIDAGYAVYVRSYMQRARLYEQLGEKDRAIASYERFLELWKDAEAPLQPQLSEARMAIGRLRDTRPIAKATLPR